MIPMRTMWAVLFGESSEALARGVLAGSYKKRSAKSVTGQRGVTGEVIVY
jgi:hypothetical protein